MSASRHNFATAEKPAVLLDAGSRGWRVRFLQLAAVLFTVLMAGVAISIVLNPGTDAQDTVIPLWQRLAIATFLSALGLACVAGMALYGTLYVTNLERAGPTLRVSTLGVLRKQRIIFLPVDEVVLGKRHEGKFGGFRTYHRVHAPWQALWLPGRRLPMLLDMQAPVVKRGAIRRLARNGGVAAAHQQPRA